jgi:peptidoglycan/LPS O-acetylase OafA/YrhL
MNKLSNADAGKPNQFDLLRHFAALLVLWSHSFSLSMASTDPLLGTILNGATGVNIFFAISGYLIAESWFRRSNMVTFVEARFLRIMPALAVSLVISALVVGPILSPLPLLDYLKHWQLRWFVFGNASLLWMGEELPLVFANNPHPKVINGSLWTLPKEATMYGFILLAGLFTKLWGGRLLFFVICILFFVVATLEYINLGQTESSLSLVRVARYFLLGAALYLAVPKAAVRFWIFVVLVLLALSGWQSAWLSPLALTYGVFWFAFTPVWKRIGGRWPVDLSYGLYIYGYFIQQVVFSVLPNISGYLAFVIAFFLTASIASLSWIYVERPALQLRGRTSHFFLPHNAGPI